uniref:Uncharacterized protein n=1 Tax=Cucumis melo TaxID=3656 RepID=A0A9I9ELE2_CUCME
RTKKGSVRGRTNSTSSNGNRPSSSSNSAPSPMSADQYAMDLGFTMVTRSRTRSFGIRVGSPTESSTLPRPLVNLIHPSVTHGLFLFVRTNFPLRFIQRWNNFSLTDDVLSTPIQESYFYFSR